MKYRIHATYNDAFGYCLGDTNDLLFGDLGGPEDGYSVEFETVPEASAAIEKLKKTGDWDGAEPVYSIHEFE